MAEDFRSEVAEAWEMRALHLLTMEWVYFAGVLGVAVFSTRYDQWGPLSFLFIVIFLGLGILMDRWRTDALKRAAAARERHKKGRLT